MVVISCKMLGEIICIIIPDTFLACLMVIERFAAIYSASLKKHQLGAKVTKMATPPHIIAV